VDDQRDFENEEQQHERHGGFPQRWSIGTQPNGLARAIIIQ